MIKNKYTLDIDVTVTEITSWFIYRRDACRPAAAPVDQNNHTSAASGNDESDTAAIIQPARENKGKEPSLSLMKVIIKHYGHILAVVCITVYWIFLGFIYAFVDGTS
mgnify:CR=1 FL=1